MTERRLTLKELSRGKRIVRFKIDEQTHRGLKFTVCGDKFKTEWETIASCGGPDVDFCLFFVRGEEHRYDNRDMRASLERYDKIVKAVAEYNRTNGGEHD